MKTAFTLLRLEARRSLALWLVPLFAVLTIYVAVGELPEGVWIWANVSVALQYALILVGSLASGLGAWIASRNRRRNIEELLSTTPLSSATRDLTTWAATAIWISCGYALAATVLLCVTSVYVTWGSPDVAPVFAGFFALVMWCSVGYAIGYLLPRIFTTVFVVILTYLVQGIMSVFYGSYLFPISTPVPDVFYGSFPPVSATQSALFAGIAILALGVVVMKARRPNIILCLLLLIVGLPTLAAAGILLKTDPSVIPERAGVASIDYDPVCEDQSKVTVCVHPAYETLLSEVAAMVDKMTQPLSGIPEAPVRAAQVSTQPATLTPEGTLEFFLYDEAALDYQFPTELATALVQDSESYEKGEELTKLQTVIAASLVESSVVTNPEDIFPDLSERDTAEAFGRFSNLSLEEKRVWLEENYGRVREEKASLEDLP